jgi:aldehyde dehydrogenase (NAD+)
MDILKVFDTMPYGPAPESQAAAIAWLEEHERKYGLFIDNTWKFPKDAQYYPSMNPATGEKLADSVQAGQEDVDEAVASARQAFEDWSHTPRLRASALSLRHCAQYPEAPCIVGIT